MPNTNFYLEFSPYTYPGLYADLLKDTLPDEIREIGLLVRKSLVHRMTLKNGNTGSNIDMRYGDMTLLPWYVQPEDDIYVTSASMLAELYRRDPRGLIQDRDVKDKLILTCRFTSVLMASLLKIKGIPARVRSGFVPYISVENLPNGTSDDHWVNQYWDFKSSRWITIDVDASIDGYLKFDPYDIPTEEFNFSADAWLNCREKKIDPNHFHSA